jgi:hypothetical protein
LLVARQLRALADLEIAPYQEQVNAWAKDFSERYLRWEPLFRRAPQDFENDIRFFRLGMIQQYLENEIGIEYIESQRNLDRIQYTNPSDLFLSGLIDTRRGTCGNMAALHVAIAWRLSWPVSLACVGSHFLVRFDDGITTYNMEATQSGFGGFKSDSDEYLIEEHQLPEVAVLGGSDLRALSPREMIGVFIGLRARHLVDVGRSARNEAALLASECDWLLARSLFPGSRHLYKQQIAVSTFRGDCLFVPGEAGNPSTYFAAIDQMRRMRRSPGWQSAAIAPRATQEATFIHLVDQALTEKETKP